MRRFAIGLLLSLAMFATACRSPEDVAGKLTLAWSDGRAALKAWPRINADAVAKYRASVQLADEAAGKPPAWEGSTDARWLAVGRMHSALGLLDVVMEQAQAETDPSGRYALAAMSQHCETQWAEATAAYEAAR